MKTKRFCVVFSLMMGMTVGLLSSPGVAAAREKDDKKPWYDQEKVRFFWGHWRYLFESGTTPVQLMENLSRLNASVYVDAELREDSTDFISPYEDEFLGQGATHATANGVPGSVYFDLEMARLASERGIHYFGGANTNSVPFYAKDLSKTKTLRWAIGTAGEIQVGDERFGLPLPCPMDEVFYESWIFGPTLKAAGTGIVDGLHFDWEKYGGRREAEICYCDVCFNAFTENRGAHVEVPRAERHGWIEENRLADEYVRVHDERRRAFWKGFADRVHEIKPDFIFSGYAFPDCPAEYYYGLNSPEAPFFLVDESHYWPIYTAPWWETYYSDHRKLGIRHILGSYTGGLYGERPMMNVSATQWAYDAAINLDGYWIWFEHQWGPNDFRVFRTAEQRISTTENRVGNFLFDGERDHAYVCLVEQSGDPILGENIIQRSFHLGARHLVQVNNVNTDFPVEVLVRFGQLPTDTQWTVKDAMTDQYYAPESGRALWSSQDLRHGVLLAMEKRSETWLIVSPAGDGLNIDSDMLIDSTTIAGHPDRPLNQGTVPIGTPLGGTFPLVYLKNGPLGYSAASPSPNPVIGTSVHYIDAAGDGSSEKELFGTKGNCWSASLSPDNTKIAFSCYVNGKGQIYVMNSDGTDPYNISDNAFCDTMPVWSPDGQRIAFVSDRDGNWEIYLMDVSGNNPLRITDSTGVDRRPSWSPDGKSIAFESDRGGDFDIYVISADGSGERCLKHRPGNEYEPIWSPDGKSIACTAWYIGRKRDVVVMDAETGISVHPEGLTKEAKGYWQYRELRSISFSPDGKHIAGAGGDIRSSVFTVGTDGTDLRELVKKDPLKPYPGGGGGEKHNLIGGWYYNGSASRRWLPKTFDNVSWSPDGNVIAFSSDMDSSGYSFLYTIDRDGNNLNRLNATLYPDGPLNEATDSESPTIGIKRSGFATTPSSEAGYIDGADYLALAPKLSLVANLPVDGWSFKADAAGVGVTQGYFNASSATSDFSRIRIGDFWDPQGYNGLTQGWYRLQYTCPPLPEGKRVFINFGAVDESAWLYVDGELVAWYDTADPDQTWDKPFLFDVTGILKSHAEQTLVIRVSNTSSVGGIWKPISLMVER